jgi:hypothetical protein
MRWDELYRDVKEKSDFDVDDQWSLDWKIQSQLLSDLFIPLTHRNSTMTSTNPCIAQPSQYESSTIHGRHINPSKQQRIRTALNSSAWTHTYIHQHSTSGAGRWTVTNTAWMSRTDISFCAGGCLRGRSANGHDDAVILPDGSRIGRFTNLGAGSQLRRGGDERIEQRIAHELDPVHGRIQTAMSQTVDFEVFTSSSSSKHTSTLDKRSR